MANREASVAILGEPLSQAEIEAFVAAWYRKLDRHAPAEELLPLVSEQCLVIQVMEECLEMHFPEGRLNGADEFRRWYEGVIRIFFDEVHTVTRVKAAWQTDRALVDVVVNWQARRWRPPAPRSEWLGFDAYQQWEMIRSPASGRPVILRYVVNELRPMPGSQPL
jgi:hypothetical protein